MKLKSLDSSIMGDDSHLDECEAYAFQIWSLSALESEKRSQSKSILLISSWSEGEKWVEVGKARINARGRSLHSAVTPRGVI